MLARFAKEAAIHDELWQKIMHYMDNCRFGIVVFEEINERDFNPDMSMERGYLFARERRCLVLKEAMAVSA